MSILNNKTLIKSVGFGDDKMYIELNTSRVLTVPYTYTKRLENATNKELKNYRLIANGVGIHFEEIDEDISIDGIIRDFGNETKRINISLQANFLDMVDNYAKEHHMSRSALFQKATLDYMVS
jgi:5'-3' exonuclease